METNAPKGYQLNQQKWPFTIKENQTETTTVTAVNDIIKGSAELSKIGEGGERLEGAQFKLLDKEGQELQNSLVTGENGKITINELRPGTYQLVETKAPDGYVLDETPIQFEVPLDPNNRSSFRKRIYMKKCIRSDERRGRWQETSRGSI